MSSLIGRVVRSEILVKLVDYLSGSYTIFQHFLRIGLSNYLFMHRLPLLLPLALLLMVVFVGDLNTSLIVQLFFIAIHLGSNLTGRRERLRRFSPILRELFQYQDRRLGDKIALLHLGLSIALYCINGILLVYFLFMRVSYTLLFLKLSAISIESQVRLM